MKRFYIILILLSLAGWILVVLNHFFLMENHSEVTFCWFKTLTGYPCPACGVGRGINSIIGFHFTEAVLYNPFSLVVAVCGVLIPFWIFFDFFRKEASLYRFNVNFGGWLAKRPYLILMLVLLVISNWIWNLTKY